MNSKIISAFILSVLFVVSIAMAEEFEDFDKNSQLQDLSPPERCVFDAAAQNDSSALMECFSKDVFVNIAGMKFKGPKELVAFAERDIWGGKYKVEKALRQGNNEIVHCLFWPRGWSSPEPFIEYQFTIKREKSRAGRANIAEPQ